jgi:hypothetical protein
MNAKVDRGYAVLSDMSALDADDQQYWSSADLKDKLQTITYLRECFYGAEATTGRLQGFYRLVEQA